MIDLSENLGVLVISNLGEELKEMPQHVISPYSFPLKFRGAGDPIFYCLPQVANQGWGMPLYDDKGESIYPGTLGGDHQAKVVVEDTENEGEFSPLASQGHAGFGNIDWVGPDIAGTRPILTFHGPQSRHLASNNFNYGSDESHAEIYLRGKIHAIAPFPVLGAALKQINGVWYTLAVCKDGTTDIFLSKRVNQSVIPTEVDDELKQQMIKMYHKTNAPWGWSELRRISVAEWASDNTTVLAARTPWFFNEKCTEVVSAREVEKEFNNGVTDTTEQLKVMLQASVDNVGEFINIIGAVMNYSDRTFTTVITSVKYGGDHISIPEDIVVDYTNTDRTRYFGDLPSVLPTAADYTRWNTNYGPHFMEGQGIISFDGTSYTTAITYGAAAQEWRGNHITQTLNTTGELFLCADFHGDVLVKAFTKNNTVIQSLCNMYVSCLLDTLTDIRFTPQVNPNPSSPDNSFDSVQWNEQNDSLYGVPYNVEGAIRGMRWYDIMPSEPRTDFVPEPNVDSFSMPVLQTFYTVGGAQYQEWPFVPQNLAVDTGPHRIIEQTHPTQAQLDPYAGSSGSLLGLAGGLEVVTYADGLTQDHKTVLAATGPYTEDVLFGVVEITAGIGGLNEYTEVMRSLAYIDIRDDSPMFISSDHIRYHNSITNTGGGARSTGTYTNKVRAISAGANLIDLLMDDPVDFSYESFGFPVFGTWSFYRYEEWGDDHSFLFWAGDNDILDRPRPPYKMSEIREGYSVPSTVHYTCTTGESPIPVNDPLQFEPSVGAFYPPPADGANKTHHWSYTQEHHTNVWMTMLGDGYNVALDIGKPLADMQPTVESFFKGSPTLVTEHQEDGSDIYKCRLSVPMDEVLDKDVEDNMQLGVARTVDTQGSIHYSISIKATNPLGEEKFVSYTTLTSGTLVDLIQVGETFYPLSPI